ncbi:hypothetical protein GGF32_005884 [Allomyces javanicus]|nr:hypothetical protein GGF32_005884 [Allomyces javanicus]
MMALYASTIVRAVRLLWSKRSWFYATILAVMFLQLFDVLFMLFFRPRRDTPAWLMALDYLAFALNMILFATMNFQRYRLLGGALWPRTTKFLMACTALFAAHWTGIAIFGWVNITTTGFYGDDAVIPFWTAGYIFDAVLNATLTGAFLVHLRAMGRGNDFRPGLRSYVTRAQLLLVFESTLLLAMVVIQNYDWEIDPLFLLGFLSQAIRISIYCALLQLLTKIMAPVTHSHNSRPGADSTLGSTAAPLTMPHQYGSHGSILDRHTDGGGSSTGSYGGRRPARHGDTRVGNGGTVVCESRDGWPLATLDDVVVDKNETR